MIPYSSANLGHGGGWGLPHPEPHSYSGKRSVDFELPRDQAGFAAFLSGYGTSPAPTRPAWTYPSSYSFRENNNYMDLRAPRHRRWRSSGGCVCEDCVPNLNPNAFCGCPDCTRMSGAAAAASRNYGYGYGGPVRPPAAGAVPPPQYYRPVRAPNPEATGNSNIGSSGCPACVAAAASGAREVATGCRPQRQIPASMGPACGCGGPCGPGNQTPPSMGAARAEDCEPLIIRPVMGPPEASCRCRKKHRGLWGGLCRKVSKFL